MAQAAVTRQSMGSPVRGDRETTAEDELDEGGVEEDVVDELDELDVVVLDEELEVVLDDELDVVVELLDEVVVLDELDDVLPSLTVALGRTTTS